MARKRGPRGGSTIRVRDGYTNVMARFGQGTDNLASRGGYAATGSLTSSPADLEAMYRQSWIVGKIVDAVAEDMTRAGVEISADWTPSDKEQVQTSLEDLRCWETIRELISWGRLYGGAAALVMVDGQDVGTPLNTSATGRGAFRGLRAFDRWQLWPDTTTLIGEMGPAFGDPEYYVLMNQTYTGVMPPKAELRNGVRIHHSRLFRSIGISLPPRQKGMEQGWGESVVERLFDRLLAFDSTTAGVANLVFKAHLRVAKFEGLRDNILGKGGKFEQAFMRNLDMIRLAQSNEGLTVLDTKDDIQAQSYTFAGLDKVLLAFGEQLSGATGIPLTRLFGQSPAGLSSTGESDLRTYYDMIAARRESDLRQYVQTMLELQSWSLFGRPVPDGMSFEFGSLWEMSNTDKAAVDASDTTAVVAAHEAGLIDRATALEELRQRGSVTGRWSNITDDIIAAAGTDDVPLAPEGAAKGDLFASV